ncbi:hypothetical protein [Hyalangium sp.]|uniref:hypothetical protein n=1 Tax=Hyalangium sp. TaxID=2028555 RepID=UPI002D77D325|nr:hypothetical protein [Hyalangium sp.]
MRAALVEMEQTGAKRPLDTEVAGLRHEVERLAQAFERLTDDPPAHRPLLTFTLLRAIPHEKGPQNDWAVGQRATAQEGRQLGLF